MHISNKVLYNRISAHFWGIRFCEHIRFFMLFNHFRNDQRLPKDKIVFIKEINPPLFLDKFQAKVIDKSEARLPENSMEKPIYVSMGETIEDAVDQAVRSWLSSNE